MKLFLLLILAYISTSSFGQTIDIEELDINASSYATLDFGTIKAKKTSKKVLTISNSGTETLVITKLEEGCDCTTVRLKQRQIAPNKSTKIRLKWKPINESEFHSSIMIHSNAQNHDQLWIQLEGNVESP